MKTISHESFMDIALEQAIIAYKKHEVPIGAVIVDEKNRIIARAYNAVEKKQSQAAHAEILAIQKATKKLGSWRLNGCRIYVTLEPCLMCFSLIQLSRLDGLFFGAHSTLFGISTLEAHPIYAKKIILQGGIKKHKSLELLASFFNTIRPKRKGSL